MFETKIMTQTFKTKNDFECNISPFKNNFSGKSTNTKGCEILSPNDYWMLLVSAILTLPGFIMGSYIVEKIGNHSNSVFTQVDW